MKGKFKMTSDKSNAQYPETGSKDYRAFVGAFNFYDIVGADQFNLLTIKGLRENHKLLDIGCGSLRGGKLFIPYLKSGQYCGVEPEEWLVKQGIEENLGGELIKLKAPRFDYNGNFDFHMFDETFDYLIACSIFSHASQKQIVKCLSSAKEVMHNESMFFASFKEGDNNYSEDKWAYPDVITYQYNWIEQSARQIGLQCTKIDWTSPHLQTWVVFVRSYFDKNMLEKLKTINTFHHYRRK